MVFLSVKIHKRAHQYFNLQYFLLFAELVIHKTTDSVANSADVQADLEFHLSTASSEQNIKHLVSKVYVRACISWDTDIIPT